MNIAATSWSAPNRSYASGDATSLRKHDRRVKQVKLTKHVSSGTKSGRTAPGGRNRKDASQYLYDRRSKHELLDEINGYEADILELHEEEDTFKEINSEAHARVRGEEENNGSKKEDETDKEKKLEEEMEDDEDECYFGVRMCMFF